MSQYFSKTDILLINNVILRNIMLRKAEGGSVHIAIHYSVCKHVCLTICRHEYI